MLGVEPLSIPERSLSSLRFHLEPAQGFPLRISHRFRKRDAPKTRVPAVGLIDAEKGCLNSESKVDREPAKGQKLRSAPEQLSSAISEVPSARIRNHKVEDA